MVVFKNGWSRVNTIISVILGGCALVGVLIGLDARYTKAKEFDEFKISSYEYRIQQRIDWLKAQIREMSYRVGTNVNQMTEAQRKYWYWLHDELDKQQKALEKLYRK